MMTYKVLFRIIPVVMIFLLLSCTSASTGSTIKIGVILPLTGKYAVIGEGEQKGIEMAIDRLKKQFPEEKIEVVYEDFASDTKNAPTAANRLISIENVDAIITSTTAASEAVSPIVESAKKIHFVISPDLEIVKKSDYNFRIYYNFNTEAQVINKFIDDVKPSSVAFLASKYSSLQKLIEEGLEPELEKTGIPVKGKELVEVTDKDFKNPILKLKDTKPAMWFLAPMTNQVDLYTNQLNDQGVVPNDSVILVGSFTFNWKPADFISTLEGYHIATPVFQTYAKDNIFIKKFNKKYNTDPSFDMAYAYDNVLILSELLISSGKDFDKFKEAFNQMGEYEGASGKISFVGNNETNAEIVITKIKGRKQVPLSN